MKLGIGVRVRHSQDKKIKGEIVKCINEDDAWDIRRQGLRYEVYAPSSGLWSVPASSLEKVYRRSRNGRN